MPLSSLHLEVVGTFWAYSHEKWAQKSLVIICIHWENYLKMFLKIWYTENNYCFLPDASHYCICKADTSEKNVEKLLKSVTRGTVALMHLGTAVDGSECYLVKVKDKKLWNVLVHYHGIVTLEGVTVAACNIFTDIPHCFCPCCCLHMCQLKHIFKFHTKNIFLIFHYSVIGLGEFLWMWFLSENFILSRKHSNLPRTKDPSP